jgi:hypothetical protein
MVPWALVAMCASSQALGQLSGGMYRFPLVAALVMFSLRAATLIKPVQTPVL